MDDRANSPQNTFHQLVTGYWISQSICTIAKLRVADALRNGPLSCQTIAKDLDVDPGSLYRLMRALASVGLFTQTETNTFGLTRLGECLISDAPGSLHAFAVMHGEQFHWDSWGDLYETIKTGKPAFQRLYKKSLFQYLAEKPDIGRNFDTVMTELARLDNHAIVSNWPSLDTGTVVDVGGGAGSLLVLLLQTFPNLQGVLVDQAHVVQAAAQAVRVAGLDKRCSIVSGDFFEAIPSGGDTYILKYILHDWDDESAVSILKNVRRSMGNRSKLLVIEQVMPAGGEPSISKFLDLQMLILLGGQVRTEVEYRSLYETAGFELTRVTPTASPLSLLEARPV